MNTTKIEDLPVVEELDSEEMAAVHGGGNASSYVLGVDLYTQSGPLATTGTTTTTTTTNGTSKQGTPVQNQTPQPAQQLGCKFL